MNALPHAVEPSLSWNAPLRIGMVSLTVRDLPRVSAYYQEVLGLHLLEGGKDTARLGAGNRVLLELREDKSARERSPREAGLFHTAFLLPNRRDLAAWIGHAVERRIPVAGASDHLVSEALYLSDPEGNGIEIYADRPVAEWHRNNGTIEMVTDPLDIEAIMEAGQGARWSGMPDGGFVGHLHLQVGDIPAAEAFYGTLLGFDVTYRVPGGTFYAMGGYHHHLATNTWNSRGAGETDGKATGLAGFELEATSKDAYEHMLARLEQVRLGHRCRHATRSLGNAGYPRAGLT